MTWGVRIMVLDDWCSLMFPFLSFPTSEDQWNGIHRVPMEKCASRSLATQCYSLSCSLLVKTTP